MIIVKMMGGLGNQMFQYAFSRELAWLYQEKVVYDLTSYNTDKQRKLELYNFNVPILTDWREKLSVKQQKEILKEEMVYRIIQKGMRILHNSDRVGERLYNHYATKGRYFNFDPYFYPTPKVSTSLKVAYGYFQGEEYFQNVIQEIINSFTITKPISEEKEILKSIESSNAVCVHIRGGDYKQFKNRRFNVIKDGYFKKGIKLIKDKIDNPVFFVFTNDKQVQNEYRNLTSNCVFVTGMNSLQDFRLMTACKHFIISNSTFSWWASYLSKGINKTVIVPEKWRRNQECKPALMKTNGIEYIYL